MTRIELEEKAPCANYEAPLVSESDKENCVEKSHWLGILNPFIGFLRVGGQLTQALTLYDREHLVILGKCHLSELLIRQVNSR